MRPLSAALLPAILAATLPLAALAQPVPSAAPPAASPPKLVVVISVDQFSADLFAEYRPYFTGGLARLQQGVVFPSAYQSHAATETCPGHSTILTGDHPSRTGIIANDWFDPAAPRADKTVYCAEDETVPGSTSKSYTVSDKHLKVDTLGDRLKRISPASRVVSVAGKDRAAVLMGGHRADQLWWWDTMKGRSFMSYAGRTPPPAVVRANAEATRMLAAGSRPLDPPALCRAHAQPVALANGMTVGAGRFERAPDDAKAFRASPELDGTVLALAAALTQDMKLGRGPATDMLIVGASATDYVGHAYGTEGQEMCLQLLSLDRSLGDFFRVLDATGVDYLVVLTADHGGHDLPERNRMHAAPDAARATPAVSAEAVGARIQQQLGLSVNPLHGGSFGDVWLERSLSPADRQRVTAAALAAWRAQPQVQQAFTASEIAATPPAKGPPESWSLLERLRASYDPQRSGDFYVVLKERTTPIITPGPGYVATHGSIWNYDRRVPLLFWRKGLNHFEQPLGVETVDIAPTLAPLIGVQLRPGDVDGRCLDLDAGPGSTCPG